MTTKIHFEWRHGYRYSVVEPAAPEPRPDAPPPTLLTSYVDTSPRLVWGAGDVPTMPLENFDDLYLRFAALDGSPEAVTAFAACNGMLQHQPGDSGSERLDDWRAEIRRMREVIDLIERHGPPREIDPEGLSIAKVTVRLVNAERGRPTLVYSPDNLRQAMWLQLALAVVGGRGIKTCEECGNPFEAGGGGKRSVARFCSSKCRDRWHNKRRAAK